MERIKLAGSLDWYMPFVKPPVPVPKKHEPAKGTRAVLKRLGKAAAVGALTGAAGMSVIAPLGAGATAHFEHAASMREVRAGTKRWANDYELGGGPLSKILSQDTALRALDKRMKALDARLKDEFGLSDQVIRHLNFPDEATLQRLVREGHVKPNPPAALRQTLLESGMVQKGIAARQAELQVAAMEKARPAIVASATKQGLKTGFWFGLLGGLLGGLFRGVWQMRKEAKRKLERVERQARR